MFYKFINGKKFYCDEKGVLTLKDGATQEVPATDTTTPDVDAGVDEVAKMVSEAVTKAVGASAAATKEATEKATEAITDMLDAVATAATTKKAAVKIPAQRTASFDVDKVKAGLESFETKQSKGSFTFKFKDAAELDMLTKGTDRSDFTGDVVAPDRDPSISLPPTRRTFLEDIARVIPTESDVVTYTEVYNSTGSPASTAELAAIPQVDRQARVIRKSVEKIAAISKHSVEIAKYAPEFVAVIKQMLNVDLKVVTEDELLSGNGTSPHLQGIIGIAEVLDATAIGALRIASANRFDAIRVAIAKIIVAGEGQYMPNLVLLNPIDSMLMDCEKNESGDYVLPPFKTADGTLIKNVRVLESVAIDQGDFLIGDFNRMEIRPKGGYEVEFSDSDGDDFSNDILAIKVRRFLTSVVKNNDSGAFMYATFDDVIAALIAA